MTPKYEIIEIMPQILNIGLEDSRIGSMLSYYPCTNFHDKFFGDRIDSENHQANISKALKRKWEVFEART